MTVAPSLWVADFCHRSQLAIMGAEMFSSHFSSCVFI